jgi:hypothetical protein
MSRSDEYRDVAQRLNRAIGSLVIELLPLGRKEQHSWRIGSTAGEAGSSMAVMLAGPRQGRWCDFATAEKGDALDLVAATRCAGDKRQAFDWARDWLRLPRHEPAPRAEHAGAVDRDDDASRYQRSIERCWNEARKLVRDDPVDRYLRARDIDLRLVERAPRALRCHQALWNSQSQCSWPAMVAAITAPDGTLLAVHRTWLTAEGTKAPLAEPKRTLGSYRGGAIKLWRGANRERAWQDMAKGETVLIGEGIEDVLTAVTHWPKWRAIAAVSLSAMLTTELPQTIGTIVALGQNDHPEGDAAELFRVVLRKWLANGRRVQVARPPAFVKDWNELARWERETGRKLVLNVD